MRWRRAAFRQRGLAMIECDESNEQRDKHPYQDLAAMLCRALQSAAPRAALAIDARTG